jgi:hypothetical protein
VSSDAPAKLAKQRSKSSLTSIEVVATERF